jgi:HTH-type transcriptional regulator/antitoxin HipB
VTQPLPTGRIAQLSRAVRTRRVDLGLLQAELADLAGCSERFVTALEAGKATVRLDKVLDVLAVLGFDLEVVSEPGQGRITARDPNDAAGTRRRVAARGRR